jgi:uncharacterized protein YecT (DUF1311 family)
MMMTFRTYLQQMGAIAVGLSCFAIAPVSAQTIASAQQLGVAPLQCAEENQQALNRCALNWAKTADFLRSLIYEELETGLSRPMQSQLVQVEKAWTMFRDVHCEELSQPFQDGSIYPLLYHSCRARMTNDRIADLQAMGEISLTPAVATQRLTQRVNSLQLQQTAGQRQWQRYQTLHCQFEARQLAEQPEQLKQCRQRLTEARIRELDSMDSAR